MIDVHDMMVGNWYRDDKNDAITALTPHFAYYQTIFSTCSGIPVTADMLKRIGFEEYEDLPLERNFYRYWDKDRRYKLEVCDDEGWCNSDRKFTLSIDNSRCMGVGSAEFTYVHELQNLVRIITGFSLPITKEMVEDV